MVVKKSKFDKRVREYILPQRIVGLGGAVESAQMLMLSKYDQAVLNPQDCCTIRGNSWILLDFGKEMYGHIHLITGKTKENKHVRLRVRFGESAAEAMAELGGDKNAVNDHSMRDIVFTVPYLSSFETNLTGFRFVRIDLLDEQNFVEILTLRAVSVYRDIPYLGSFECSDERLNKIWQTGAYTVHLNMQDYLWDGIKRDRLIWVGDMHPETKTISAVFGYNDIVPASLDLICNQTPLPEWMNGISSYSLWWIIIHHDWYWHHGDIEYLKQQKEYLLGLLEMLLKCIKDNGSENLPDWRFLDWPSSANPDAVHAGLHALLFMAFQKGGQLCKILNENSMMQKCHESCQKMLSYKPNPAASKQAAALMALTGLADAKEINKNILSVGGATNMSTFFGYYVLQARAKAGDIAGCLDCIRQYWGGMLDMGATTFWEDFDIAWLENSAPITDIAPAGKRDIHGDFGDYCYKGFRHSLCHGWASGSTAWLSEHVLGVKILEPGCVKIQIVPNLGDLQWAQGTFPTPQGVLKVTHKKENGKIKTDYSILNNSLSKEQP